MRASSGVSSLSDDFRTRRVGVPEVAIQQPPSSGRRVGFISSVAIIAAAVLFGWLVGSGRLPGAIDVLRTLLPWT